MTAGQAVELAVCVIAAILIYAAVCSLIGRRFHQMDQDRLSQMSAKTKKALGL